MNFYRFYQIMKESKIQEMERDYQKILVYNYSPQVQIQSGIGERDREYFNQLFQNGNPSAAGLEEFIHSYAEGWSASSGSSLGSKIIAYDDGKVVLGKAPYHSFLAYYPNDPKLPKLEGYFNIKNKAITVSHVNNDSFFKLETWKKILGSLLKAGLVDNNWRMIGCPPNCPAPSHLGLDKDGLDVESDKEYVLVGELLSQKSDISSQDADKSKKEKEAEELVRNFMTQQAIKNKNSNMMGYMYRYGDHTEH